MVTSVWRHPRPSCLIYPKEAYPLPRSKLEQLEQIEQREQCGQLDPLEYLEQLEQLGQLGIKQL